MVIGMDDFKIGEWYGIYTESIGRTVGCLVGKEHVEGMQRQEDRLVLNVKNSGNTVGINIEDIEDYFWVQITDTDVDVKIFNDALKAFGVNCGDTTTEVLNRYIESWDKYSEEDKEFAVSEVANALTNKNIQDLIGGLVNYKKYFDEQYQNYIDVLKNQNEFLMRYSNFKELLPDGIRKIYDTILYDICGLKIG